MHIWTFAVRLTALLFAGSAMLGFLSGCDKEDSKPTATSESAIAVRAVDVRPTDEMLWIETLGET